MKKPHRCVLLAFIVWVSLKESFSLPVPEDELDTSTRLLGSSVVTSVSVVTGTEKNGGSIMQSRRVIPGLDLPPSPGGLLRPDKFQFYTLNKNGEVVTKQMTEKEIQLLIAAGGGHFPTEIHETQSAGDVPTSGMKVADVVQNVQNVLKSELSKPTTVMSSVPTIPGHATDEWSSILPSILAGDMETQSLTIPDSEMTQVKHNAPVFKPETEPQPETPASESKSKPNATESSTKNPVEEQESPTFITHKPLIENHFKVPVLADNYHPHHHHHDPLPSGIHFEPLSVYTTPKPGSNLEKLPPKPDDFISKIPAIQGTKRPDHEKPTISGGPIKKPTPPPLKTTPGPSKTPGPAKTPTPSRTPPPKTTKRPYYTYRPEYPPVSYSEIPMIPVHVITADQILTSTPQYQKDTAPVFQVLNTISADTASGSNSTKIVHDKIPEKSPVYKPEKTSEKPTSERPKTPLPEIIISETSLYTKLPELVTEVPTLSVVSETHTTSVKIPGFPEIPITLEKLDTTAQPETKTTMAMKTEGEPDSTDRKPGEQVQKHSDKPVDDHLMDPLIHQVSNKPDRNKPDFDQASTLLDVTTQLFDSDSTSPFGSKATSVMETKTTTARYESRTTAKSETKTTESPDSKTSTTDRVSESTVPDSLVFETTEYVPEASTFPALKEPQFQRIPDLPDDPETSAIEKIIETLHQPTESKFGTSTTIGINTEVTDQEPEFSTTFRILGEDSSTPAYTLVTNPSTDNAEGTTWSIGTKVKSSTVASLLNSVEMTTKPYEPLPTELADSLSSMISQISEAVPSLVSQNSLLTEVPLMDGDKYDLMKVGTYQDNTESSKVTEDLLGFETTFYKNANVDIGATVRMEESTENLKDSGSTSRPEESSKTDQADDSGSHSTVPASVEAESSSVDSVASVTEDSFAKTSVPSVSSTGSVLSSVTQTPSASSVSTASVASTASSGSAVSSSSAASSASTASVASTASAGSAVSSSSAASSASTASVASTASAGSAVSSTTVAISTSAGSLKTSEASLPSKSALDSSTTASLSTAPTSSSSSSFSSSSSSSLPASSSSSASASTVSPVSASTTPISATSSPAADAMENLKSSSQMEHATEEAGPEHDQLPQSDESHKVSSINRTEKPIIRVDVTETGSTSSPADDEGNGVTESPVIRIHMSDAVSMINNLLATAPAQTTTSYVPLTLPDDENSSGNLIGSGLVAGFHPRNETTFVPVKLQSESSTTSSSMKIEKIKDAENKVTLAEDKEKNATDNIRDSDGKIKGTEVGSKNNEDQIKIQDEIEDDKIKISEEKMKIVDKIKVEDKIKDAEEEKVQNREEIREEEIVKNTELKKEEEKIKSTEKVKEKENVKSSEQEKIKNTEESREKIKNTEESKEKIKNTEKSKEKLKITEESKDKIKNTEESKEKIRNTEESKDKIKNTEESKDKIKNTEESKEEIRNTEESKEKIKNAEESKEKIKITEESKDKIKNTEESKEKITNTEESKEKIKNAEESKEKIKIPEPSKEKLKPTEQSKEKIKTVEKNKNPAQINEKEEIKNTEEMKNKNKIQTNEEIKKQEKIKTEELKNDQKMKNPDQQVSNEPKIPSINNIPISSSTTEKVIISNATKNESQTKTSTSSEKENSTTTVSDKTESTTKKMEQSPNVTPSPATKIDSSETGTEEKMKTTTPISSSKKTPTKIPNLDQIPDSSTVQKETLTRLENLTNVPISSTPKSTTKIPSTKSPTKIIATTIKSNTETVTTPKSTSADPSKLASQTVNKTRKPEIPVVRIDISPEADQHQLPTKLPLTDPISMIHSDHPTEKIPTINTSLPLESESTKKVILINDDKLKRVDATTAASVDPTKKLPIESQELRIRVNDTAVLVSKKPSPLIMTNETKIGNHSDTKQSSTKDEQAKRTEDQLVQILPHDPKNSTISNQDDTKMVIVNTTQSNKVLEDMIPIRFTSNHKEIIDQTMENAYNKLGEFDSSKFDPPVSPSRKNVTSFPPRPSTSGNKVTKPPRPSGSFKPPSGSGTTKPLGANPRPSGSGMSGSSASVHSSSPRPPAAGAVQSGVRPPAGSSSGPVQSSASVHSSSSRPPAAGAVQSGVRPPAGSFSGSRPSPGSAQSSRPSATPGPRPSTPQFPGSSAFRPSLPSKPVTPTKPSFPTKSRPSAHEPVQSGSSAPGAVQSGSRPVSNAHKPTEATRIHNEQPTDEKWALIPQPNQSAGSQSATKITKPAPTKHTARPPVQPQVALDTSQSAIGLDASIRNLEPDVIYFSNLCNELAFSFWSAANKGLSTTRSLVLSPFGMTSLLAMVFLGARGPTSSEMNDVLKLDDVATFNPHLVFQNITDTVSLSRKQGIANAAFVRELFADKSKVGKLMPFYKKQAQQFYEGFVEEVNFAAISDIVKRRTNLLIRKQTDSRIKDFVRTNTVGLRPPLAALSANVFQTECGGASSEGRDGELYFSVSPAIRQRQLVRVPATLWKSGVLAGYEPSLDATAIALGGIDKLVSMIFVIPGQQGHMAPGDNLDNLEVRLVRGAQHDGAWEKLLKVLIPRTSLELQVPKFSHRSIVNATAALKRMGLGELFSKHADLKGINGIGHDLHLADVLQMNLFSTCGDENISIGRHHMETYPEPPMRSYRAMTDSDEDSVPSDDEDFYQDEPSINISNFENDSTSRIARKAESAEKPKLKLDRPFLYFVRHNPTGLILHMGRFNPRITEKT